jgi:hypothetical protein
MSNLKIFIEDVYDVNNEYFAKMQEIIKNPNPLNKTYTERHHIIPRFIYRDKHVEIDDSAENVINVSLENHILIHFYAAKCCHACYKWKCLNSINLTLGNIKFADFEKDCVNIADIIAQAKEEFRKTHMPAEVRSKCAYDHYRFTAEERKEKFGKHLIGNTIRRGAVLSEETRAKISLHRKGKLLCHAVSAETREKISKANKGKKFGYNKEIRIAVGQFNHYRMTRLKEIFSKSTITDWNEFQRIVKLLKIQVIDELAKEKQLAKRTICKNYKEEILDRVLAQIN